MSVSQDSSYDMSSRQLFSLLLEPRSLLVLTDDMYTDLLHGISEKTSDHISEDIPNITSCGLKSGETAERTTRVSLTIRYVPKTLKIKLKI